MATSNFERESIDLLRVSFIGSVDNGKSTLIGRLLLDSHMLKLDQLEQIREGEGKFNLARVTDGLRDERAQGITIDVAYRFFQTAKRRFIICDCPGHEQYTANMCSGTSQVDAALVLLDATTQITKQSKRHLIISSMMGPKTLILGINKLDLVSHSEELYYQIQAEVQQLLNNHPFERVIFVPISALKGYNVVSNNGLSWYNGPSLLEILESIPHSHQEQRNLPLRASVQDIYTHEAEGKYERYYRLKIESGTLSLEQNVALYPSEVKTKIKSILTAHSSDLKMAQTGQCVDVNFTSELSTTRGEVLACRERALEVRQEIQATIFWFNKTPAHAKLKLIVKTRNSECLAQITDVHSVLDLDDQLYKSTCSELGQNEIGRLSLQTATPIVVDSHDLGVRATSRFILICPQTHQTLGAGIY